MSDHDAPVLDHEGAKPIYVQVADHVAGLIASGRLAPGARLDSERALAERYGVAYLTIRRANQELRARGLIETVHGRGTFVRTAERTD